MFLHHRLRFRIRNRRRRQAGRFGARVRGIGIGIGICVCVGGGGAAGGVARECGFGRGDVVGRADGDDSRAEFDADCYVVVGGEAAFAEADDEGGFAGAGVADADQLGDVVPG